MAGKSKVKSKTVVKKKVKAKVVVKRKLTAKVAVKKKVFKKLASNSNSKMKPTGKLMKNPETKVKSVVEKPNTAKEPVKLMTKPATSVKPTALVVKRVMNPLVARRPIKRSQRANQFAYMKMPGLEHEFEVGDTVEVFCDHEKSRERIRGWVKGIVVQVDHKMVAVQFRSNVYLTDGWMVPDRILWYPVNSEHIRAMPGKKPMSKKDFIPEY
jgi:hypothetical protein